MSEQSHGPERQHLAGAARSFSRVETPPAPSPPARTRPGRPIAEPPAVVVTILRSAYSVPPDPRLESVLGAFRAHWLSLGRRRYPQLADDLEDVIQNALIKLVSRDKLATLRDPARLEAWARSLFVRTVLDLLRDSRRHGEQQAYLPPPNGHPTPENLASHRERLAIVAKVTVRLEIARSKFVEDLPGKGDRSAPQADSARGLEPVETGTRILRQALDGVPSRSRAVRPRRRWPGRPGASPRPRRQAT